MKKKVKYLTKKKLQPNEMQYSDFVPRKRYKESNGIGVETSHTLREVITIK